MFAYFCRREMGSGRWDIFFGGPKNKKKPTSAALVSFVSKRLREARL